MPEKNGNPKPNFFELYQTVGRMEGKLDTALKTITVHETKINTIEKVQDQMVGKISVIGAIFGFIGGIITTIIATFIKK